MIEKKEPISLQKCPNCEYEPVDGRATCPRCGFSLQVDDQVNNDDVADKNDTIEWSKLADLPIGSVQQMFKDNEDKMKEENSKKTEETPELNPILAKYIREHKEGQDYPETSEISEIPEVSELDETVKEEVAEAEAVEEAINEEQVSDDQNSELEETVPETISVSDEAASEKDHLDEAEPAVSLEAAERITPAETETDEAIEPVAEETSEVSSGKIPEEPQTPKSSPKKSRKKLYVTLAAIAVLGAGGGYYFHAKEVEAQRIETVKKENKVLDSIEESIASYYTDDQQTFLVADKVALNTSKIDEELAHYTENERYDELKKAYDELVDKQAAEHSVDQLFTDTVINGDKIAEKPLLKAAEPIELTIETGGNKFDQLLNQAIDNAKDQYTKIEAAKKAVAGLLKDGKVNEAVTRAQYTTANNAVKAVANQALIKTQKDELVKVDQLLKDKEKKAADEKAAAEKAAQEKAAQAAQTENSVSQAGDTSSDAYAWAPGVQEKVIQTCISRGYIVEGGYSLEPVKVENGEGYYNLYATSNRASLTKGYSDSDLPMYLVTINCKTGWFKGNGPN
ncbi:cell division site-positioning protein MapZ family protein [Enterococcus pingfangensis]|uniref:cell division site-positioning protein MapZ family protein n=1 Tax=Enterococcus pingfangensis TaxID=2559924 RepID=UPI001FE77F74|nr:cell division site-positioning protein MapZ family protein [Enterococcus pingfangensis]